MAMIERYRRWYEHECDCNEKMLGMIESVAENQRDDPRFGRCLVLADHLAACRHNWLDRMINNSQDQVAWWRDEVALESLRPTFDPVQRTWTTYLDSLADEDLERDFEFGSTTGQRFRWNIEGQIVQLVGHAFYHRGQVAQLVQELGGDPVDTDYLYWEVSNSDRWGSID